MTSVTGGWIVGRCRAVAAAGRRRWAALDRGWRASALGLLVVAATAAL